MLQNLNEVRLDPKRDLGYAVLPVRPGFHEPFGVSSPVRRVQSSAPSRYADIRGMLVANVDALPSANDNLLLLRGIVSSLIKISRNHFLPRMKTRWNIIQNVAPRILKRHVAPYAKPGLAGFLALFEGTILWSLGSVATAADKAAVKPIEFLMVALSLL